MCTRFEINKIAAGLCLAMIFGKHICIKICRTITLGIKNSSNNLTAAFWIVSTVEYTAASTVKPETEDA